MIKEPRNLELTREDIFAEYFSRKTEGDLSGTTDAFEKKVRETKKLFADKTELEVLIKGNIYFDKNFKKMFTFLNKTYDISDKKNWSVFEECLRDLDDFKVFMNGEKINYFSEIENEYVNYTRVLNAKVFIELR